MDGHRTQPLSDRLRPRKLSEVLGQDSTVQALSTRQPHAFILWGPPGVGKTSIARAYAADHHLRAEQMSAISSGVKDLRAMIQLAEHHVSITGSGILLFIDEIHHFNKNQQDILLRAVEEGSLLLAGATTENPAMTLNRALLSRCHVYVLKSLDDDTQAQLLERALSHDDPLQSLDIADEAKAMLIATAAGDARVLLNLLEAVADHEGPVSAAVVKQLAERVRISHDRAGDAHYDRISAFIKSVRGSDPDAALLYLASMLEGGEDPRFIARRLVILAVEDIGLSYPQALPYAAACYDTVDRIGMPEARIALSATTCLLAGAPKSNAAYLAIDRAIDHVRKHGAPDVPAHLRNAPTQLAKRLGHGKDYLYPHAFDDHFVKQAYATDASIQGKFYQPTELGQEKALHDRLKRLWAEDSEHKS